MKCTEKWFFFSFIIINNWIIQFGMSRIDKWFDFFLKWKVRFFFWFLICIIVFIFPNFSIIFRWNSFIWFPNFLILIWNMIFFIICRGFNLSNNSSFYFILLRNTNCRTINILRNFNITIQRNTNCRTINILRNFNIIILRYTYSWTFHFRLFAFFRLLNRFLIRSF